MIQSNRISYYSRTNNPYLTGMRPRAFFSERRSQIRKEIITSAPTKSVKKSS